jgi:Uma2 family endonuclease
MYQNNPAMPVNTLPTMYDLPSEDSEEMGLPDEFHDTQPDLLKETCRPAVDNFFMGADLNLYYDVEHTGWYKRPDYFLAIGVPASTSPEDRRQSYVVWQEGVNPFLMVELLSPGTEAEDLGQTLRVVGKPPTKWQVYEQILQVPYYAVFDEFFNRFRMFCLQGGQYVEAKISGQGFWLPEIELGLGIWAGSYQGMTDRWLRWYDRSGSWIPTLEEKELLADQRANLERQNADRERELAREAKEEADRERELAREAREEADREREDARAAREDVDRERQRADFLAAKLRELGIDVDAQSNR